MNGNRILIGSALAVLGGVLVFRRKEVAEAAEQVVEQGAAHGRAIAQQGQEMIEDWMATLFGKTSEHEGTYWSVNANQDGQGVSYGFIQWTQKGGALGKLLQAMFDADPRQFAADFGSDYEALLALTQASSPEARMAPVGGKPLWDSSWVARFILAGGGYAPVPGDPEYRAGDPPGNRKTPAEWRSPANRRPVFQAVQRAQAGEGEHMQAAIRIAQMLGVQTERAMTLYYNRTVHQGAGGATSCARDLVALWKAKPEAKPALPNDILAQYAWICAERFRWEPGDDENRHVVWHPASVFYDARGRFTPYAGSKVKNTEVVGKELKGIGRGDYRTEPVDAPAGVKHAWDAGGMTNLYNLITWRSSGILTDPKLRDQPVNLANTAVPGTFNRGRA